MATEGPITVAADGDNGYQEAGVWTPNLVLFGNDGVSVLNGGLRFLSVDIAQGATINSASLKFTPRNLTGTITNVHVTVKGMAFDNVAQWSDGGVEPTSAQTTASADFDPTAWVAEQTVTVTTIVQEIINRAGWASGNAMAFALLDDSSTSGNFVRINAVNDGSGIANLTIDYTASSPVTIATPAGAEAMTGRTVSLGIGINLPNQAMGITGKALEGIAIYASNQILISPA